MSFCVAGVAQTCQKSFCVASAILSRRFQTMRRIFHGRRSTSKTSDVILRGRRSTLDVSCCVFSANRIVSPARSGDKVQIPWQAWHFVTGDENRREPRTKRRFWGRFVRKLAGKRRFWSCKVRNSKKLQNLSLSNVSKQVVMSFCVAGVAQTCQKSFCVASAILSRRFQTMRRIFHWQAQHFEDLRCHFAWQAQHFRRVVLRVFCESHCQCSAKWWQGANSVAAVAFCHTWWKIMEASTSILR